MTQVAGQTLNVGLDALTATTGVKTARDGTQFVLLPAGDYYFPCSDADGTVKAIHVELDAAIAGTFTVEVSNAPKDPSASPDTTDYDATAGKWLLYNPSSATVLVSAGSVATAATVAVTAGAVGGFLWMLPDWGPRRTRVHAHITTQGKCRVMPSGKY